MRFLSYLRELLTDFLFPKTSRVLELEALSGELLLSTLPQAVPIKDRSVVAIFDYQHPVTKEIIWEVKYGGNKKIASKLGEILYDVIKQELEDLSMFESALWQEKRPIIIPVPISDKRRGERGWNQAELLMEAVKVVDRENIFKYMPRQLIKVIHTESQTRTASRSERLHNLTNSMKILSAPSVEGRSIILVDDVTTTGSTFLEARRALKEAHVKKVLCVAVAH